MDEILDITCVVAGAFERLGIPYLIGGSLASSLHGIPRATQDVDMVADLRAAHVPAIVAALRGSFYHDEPAMRVAIERRASFNVIHLGSYFKADIFVSGDDELSRMQMSRRQPFMIGGASGCRIFVASAEDVVLQKLRWFQLGQGVSDRQWQDALGVLKVGGSRLDAAYLRSGAGLLGLDKLLHQLCSEAGFSLARRED